ncbi:hypothetical protein E2C01_096259 [Portunus trituberculatus]|uniref:Uncharacterized protein n=1 Tax=Portunus trituberculatus TaxID=210409 RepID=A0A5B7JS67_PORTR|nr:hypothetical protein [Portunus trituberculatus]
MRFTIFGSFICFIYPFLSLLLFKVKEDINNSSFSFSSSSSTSRDAAEGTVSQPASAVENVSPSIAPGVNIAITTKVSPARRHNA